MKNARTYLLILLTCICAAFTVGLLTGKNMDRAPVQVQILPATVAVKSDAGDPGPEQPAAVNVNTASAEQLQTLPHIGDVLAQRIIAYRNEHGGFTSVGELINVPGIGEKILESIWDLVTTGG